MRTAAQLGRLAARQTVKQAAPGVAGVTAPISAPSVSLGARMGQWIGSMFGGGSSAGAGAGRAGAQTPQQPQARQQPYYPTKLTGKPPMGAYTSPKKQYGPGRYTGPNYRPYPAYKGEPRR